MKDFLYEKIKAEHWKERALIAYARIEALEAALREIKELGEDGVSAARLSNIARAALAPEQDK